ncbi:MAG: hypothetical protein Q4G60_00960 [bacterium]|nr:hypothetical protein [bacterium]
MENFMDRLYSKLSTGAGQQYTSNTEPRRRENGDNKVEQLMNMMRENDSKQIECIAAMFNQESEEHVQSKQEIQRAIQNTGMSAQEILQSVQTMGAAVQNMDVVLHNIADAVQQLQTEQSFEQELPSAGPISADQLQDLEEHVHKENVKCYRNVQASVMEQAELQMEQTRNSVGPVKGMLITSLILNVATIGILIVHLLGVI